VIRDMGTRIAGSSGMKTTILTAAIALALGALAGCDRDSTAEPAGAGTSSAPQTPQSNTPSTPANAGTPSQAEKREGSNPVQQQVDPKQAAQRRDFEQKR
jgi:hypothetical protein